MPDSKPKAVITYISPYICQSGRTVSKQNRPNSYSNFRKYLDGTEQNKVKLLTQDIRNK